LGKKKGCDQPKKQKKKKHECAHRVGPTEKKGRKRKRRKRGVCGMSLGLNEKERGGERGKTDFTFWKSGPKRYWQGKRSRNSVAAPGGRGRKKRPPRKKVGEKGVERGTKQTEEVPRKALAKERGKEGKGVPEESLTMHL